jgi:uncharacterized alkaline shock family protein YloU
MCTGKVCDDPAGEVSNLLTARGGEVDAASRMTVSPNPQSKGARHMSQPTPTKTGEQTPATATSTSPATQDRLATDTGQISIADSVVQKIAGKACRELGGVHAMGTSGTRAFGALRERIPGSSGPNFVQGVGVEVGETEAAIDLDIVVEYGVGIAELGRSIQRNVKQAVERMTGLRVVEVNIAVDDVYLPSDDDQDTTSRVS